jgi:hypothetical protein
VWGAAWGAMGVSPVVGSAGPGSKKAARVAGGFQGMLLFQIFRAIATRPPPAASENRNTKSKSGCGVRSLAPLITQVLPGYECFICNRSFRFRLEREAPCPDQPAAKNIR